MKVVFHTYAAFSPLHWLQLSIIDGDSYNEGAPRASHPRELLMSDEVRGGSGGTGWRGAGGSRGRGASAAGRMLGL